MKFSRASSGLVRSGSPSRDRRHERHGSSQVLLPFNAFETALALCNQESSQPLVVSGLRGLLMFLFPREIGYARRIILGKPG